MTPNTPATLQNTIPVEQAAKFTANWRDANASTKLNTIGYVKAFNISKEDIDQLFYLIPEGGACRAYLAIDNNVSPMIIKLLLVAVTADNQDIVAIEGGRGEQPQSAVFDFTTPCPSQCAAHSVLLGD
jgi:hypothetical protein